MQTVSTRHFLALALVAAGALLAEVTLVRLISVALWYPFAFLVLATAMLGAGGAAVALSLSEGLQRLPVEALLRGSALGFALTTALGYPVWNLLPVNPMSIGGEPLQLLFVPLLLLVITLPFACAGLFVARLFAAAPHTAGLLYAADLGGAAAGVLSFVLLLPNLGGPGTLVAAAALGAAATLLLTQPLAPRLGLALLVALLVGVTTAVESFLPLRITSNKLLGTPLARSLPRRSLWTLSSAIDVIESPRDGGYLIVIDGGTAMTAAPRASRHRPSSPHGLRALPYLLTAGRSTLVVGSGGGVEVQAALGAGSERVLALEIDEAINSLVRGRLSPALGGLFAHPAVELQTAEAQSYLAAHNERFSVIVAFHTISNAASSSGAMALAENYLLTVEAMRLLLNRLADDGVLLVSRPEAQLGRLAATLARAWPFPEDVRRHVLVVTETANRPAFLAALVVSRKPLDEQALGVVRAATPGRVAYAPDNSGDSQELFAAALQGDQAEAAAATALLGYRPATLEPVSDARPFFNLNRPWHELRPADFMAVLTSGTSARARLEDLPVGQVAVLLLLLEALLVAGLFLVPPARALRKSGLPLRHTRSVAIYFAALGYGYMTVEVVLVQRLTLLVGEPAWSMVAVLAVLLAASGFGSLTLSRRLGPGRACAAAAVAALLASLAVPWIIPVAAGLPFAGRLAVAAGIVAPLGLLLGTPFAAGLAQLERREVVAWAWALNSLFSVGGSILALLVGSAFGFSVAAGIAAASYAAATLVSRGLSTKPELCSDPYDAARVDSGGAHH